MEPDQRSLDVETVSRLLAEEERHQVIKYLAEQEQVFVDEIVAEVAERGVENKEFHTRLVHIHLPKLADVGIISYNPSQDLVHPLDVDRVAGCLDVLEEQLQS